MACSKAVILALVWKGQEGTYVAFKAGILLGAGRVPIDYLCRQT